MIIFSFADQIPDWYAVRPRHPITIGAAVSVIVGSIWSMHY